jgi:pimeloyl-ACP methyl ester carboxylesterase
MTGRSRLGRDRPPRVAFSTRRLAFEVDGDRCVGTLYRPDRPVTAPAVVWGSSVPLARRRGLAPVGEALAARGYAVYCFDPRGVGESDGDPREALRRGHTDDWAAALARVRDCDSVDAGRPVLAGHGFAAGHAVAAAADDRRIGGVVAVAPVLDGRTFLRTRSRRATVRAVADGVVDRVGSVVGRGRTVPAAGIDADRAFVAAPGAAAAVRSLLPAGETLPEVPARSFLSAARFRPGERVDDIRCPTCFVAGSDDPVAPADDVADAAARARDGTFVRLPVGHFDLLRGRTRRALLDHVVAFLDREFDR